MLQLTGSMRSLNRWALQPRALEFLNHVDPLVSVSDYYIGSFVATNDLIDCNVGFSYEVISGDP